MSARINNFPKYVVYDRTYTATITTSSVVTGGGDHTMTPNITGTTQSTRDLDLSTYWKDDPTMGSGSGSNTYTITLTYDFGKIIWNCLLYCKWTGAYSKAISISDDGSSWSDLATTDGTQNFAFFSARYVRFMSYATDGKPVLTVYEVKIMGSD